MVSNSGAQLLSDAFSFPLPVMESTPPRLVKLMIVSDFSCPWCYIGHKAIDAAIAKCKAHNLPLEFDIEYRPYLLNSQMGEDEVYERQKWFLAKFGPERAATMVKVFSDRAKDLGLSLSALPFYSLLYSLAR